MQIIDLMTVGTPGPAGDASPEMIAAAEARAAQVAVPLVEALLPGAVTRAVADADIPGEVAEQVGAQVVPAATDAGRDAAIETLADQPAVVEAAAELAQSDAGLLHVEDYFPDEDIWLDPQGNVAMRRHPDGSVSIPDLKVKRFRFPDGTSIQTSDRGGLLFRDVQGFIQAWFKPDGKTYIGDPEFGTGGAVATEKVILPIIVGQSNPESRALPIGPRIDPVSSRVEEATWVKNLQPGDVTYSTAPYVNGLAPATTPMSSQQSQVGRNMGIILARRFLEYADDSTRVVLLNAAAGGSGLVSTPEQGTWAVDYSGSNPRLYPIALAAITKTIELIQAKYPGAVIEPWLFWHQGEADGGTSEAAYAAAVDALIAGLRTHLGDATIPFVAGGMVPEYATGAGHLGIRRALFGIQTRNLFAAYTDGIPNGGGSQWVIDGTHLNHDTVHYGRAGMERLAHAMFWAAQRAAVSAADAVPHKPLDVTGQLVSGTLYARWSEPETRYTNFVVQYGNLAATSDILSDTGWTTATKTIPTECAEIITGVTGPVKVRVKTVNETRVTAATLPIIAVGAS